ncbi:ATP-binding protein [Leifsonia sp. H3M29-4]|uniref:sensor histidine kinase n=1 Tax=Salinibacterium metalliresistens TaxID=3031321 RepID=UPI0023DB439F|nr:ATP-binding protein [Salinibacterium metalliresistens]MDF1477837.1 ATP-binding protein [Salinibacterium metalliresistens]
MKRPRLTFRARLGLIIMAVFIAAGAGLLAAQYLVVQELFASAIRVTLSSCVESGSMAPADSNGTLVATGCMLGSGSGDASTSVEEALPAAGTMSVSSGPVLQQSAFLSATVGEGLLPWSIALLAAFTVVAAAVAFWLARRSLDRIGEVTATARDISERDLGRRLELPGPNDEIKELGDTIDGMLDRLQLAFAAQDRFVANASHELRTPLTTTRIALEIPLDQGVVPAELEPALRRALRATLQSERLITSLLALARSRARIDGADEVDFGSLVRAELDDLAEAADARGIRVRAELTNASVKAEPVLLARAVRNLLDNAIRHNVEGGLLEVHMRREGPMVVLDVANSGEEIDASTLALLTEPFYRADASRTARGDGIGLGLGLAIVESVAATHGGRLEVVGRAGGGLIARLGLPAL